MMMMKGLGERCRLPQRGPGQSPHRKNILTHLYWSQNAPRGSIFQLPPTFPMTQNLSFPLALNARYLAVFLDSVIYNKKLSCCCDSRSYRVQIRSPHTSARTLQSALGTRSTPRSRRWHRTALCRLAALQTPLHVYWDFGAFRFLWCVLWLNDAS